MKLHLLTAFKISRIISNHPAMIPDADLILFTHQQPRHFNFQTEFNLTEQKKKVQKNISQNQSIIIFFYDTQNLSLNMDTDWQVYYSMYVHKKITVITLRLTFPFNSEMNFRSFYFM